MTKMTVFFLPRQKPLQLDLVQAVVCPCGLNCLLYECCHFGRGQIFEKNLQRLVLALCVLCEHCCIQRGIKVVVHGWDVDSVIETL